MATSNCQTHSHGPRLSDGRSNGENDHLEIPVLDLSWAQDSARKPLLLEHLRSALFDVGFLYIINHGVPSSTISRLEGSLPALFGLPSEEKVAMSKLNSPHFLGYSGFAEETTLGKQDLREQFDFATELSELTQGLPKNDSARLYWRLRGPNQWPSFTSMPGFREILTDYHNAVEALSYRSVHLIEEALDIPIGTFDGFFAPRQLTADEAGISIDPSEQNGTGSSHGSLHPQHRIKLVRYPPSPQSNSEAGQGVGAHKDSSGWLTFLYQCGCEEGLEVLSPHNEWILAPPIPNAFVVNFGNAFEAATEGAVKATVHRVIAPGPDSNVRYSIPFFQGLPLDMTVSEIRKCIPEHVRTIRKRAGGEEVSTFLDPRWDSLGESQLRKWIRSHRDVGVKWYGQEVVDYYMQ